MFESVVYNIVRVSCTLLLIGLGANATSAIFNDDGYVVLEQLIVLFFCIGGMLFMWKM